MKKAIFLLFGAVLCLGAASCSDKGKCQARKTDTDTKVYTGVLPGADVSGIRYTVLLDFDDEGKDGDFDMISTYVRADSTGITDLSSYYDEGDFTVGTTPAGVRYYTLTGDKGGKTYFLAQDDSSITMVGEDLQSSVVEGMNYTLKEVK